ncbi:MAG: DNA mismatch repair protein MutS [Clostridiales bacterium]|nr:DNA mismatch repair protein MutS [Clostridiales bacterium]
MSTMTPMMVQYCKTKEEYKDCILLYRLGDFYEMFFEDAVICSKELDLTLTGKDCGLEERAPMCGVPYHAVESYLSKLVENGHKVAICEQMEDPALAKGIVKREVVRIVTPGTNMDSKALDSGKNSFLVCIVKMEDRFGLSACDITTGEFFATETENQQILSDEIYKYAPKEILYNEAFELSGADMSFWKKEFNAALFPLKSEYLDEDYCKRILLEHFNASTIEGLGLGMMPLAAMASGCVLQYLIETQKNDLNQIFDLRAYTTGNYMVLDNFTRRNLELTETMRDKQKSGSLLGVLDRTRTAMGARHLRSCIEQPLIRIRDIVKRQEAVGELKEDILRREEMREYLSGVYDLERLISRISIGTGNPRDLIAFASSLSMLPHIKTTLRSSKAELLKDINREIDDLSDLCTLINEAICDDPPIAMKEGGIIRAGYNEEVDHLRSAKDDGKLWLAQLEARERENTGIKNLKVKFNKVFGYYLEVTNSYKDLVPETYIRKQTLANAERYYIPELKELESTILGAEDKLHALEYELFSNVRDRIAGEIKRVKQTAKAIAQIDTLASFAEVSSKNNYICPVVNQSGIIKIKEGRHPVIEAMRRNELFVPNDTFLDTKNHLISIITGPNMAGKSTYMRQSALIVLMAQIGCFVPAKEAEIGIVDRIFTRVGASDDLASGQSTFMVEMTEMASILRNATSKSLLILDEIGRGTSTFDGLSIAWAVIEYISNHKQLGARTLFATHYHELTELEGKIPGVNNYCIAVKEQGEDIFFLRKIIPGGADRSYGIQVARLAGVPSEIIERAKEVSETLSDTDIAAGVNFLLKDSKAKEKDKKKKGDTEDLNQLSLFATVRDEDIIEELLRIDVTRLTPIEALTKIDALQKKLNNRWQSQE